jgi:hypothetical protein
MCLAPIDEDLCSQLGTVVDANRRRQTTELAQLFHDANDPPGGQRGIDFNRQGLAIAFVHHVQGAKRAPCVEGILHEVERPHLVLHDRRHQGLPRDRREPAFVTPGEIQPQLAVHAPAPLVIPPVAAIPQPVKAEPEAPAPILGHRRVQRVDHGRVSLRPINPRPIPGRPRQADSRTCARDRQSMCGSKVRHRVALLGRRQSFRSMRSLSA